MQNIRSKMMRSPVRSKSKTTITTTATATKTKTTTTTTTLVGKDLKDVRPAGHEDDENEEEEEEEEDTFERLSVLDGGKTFHDDADAAALKYVFQPKDISLLHEYLALVTVL